MRLENERGEAVYYNCVMKHNLIRYQIQAASGQTIPGRDRQRRKSRTFAQQHQAEAWLRRNGYLIKFFYPGKNTAVYKLR